MAIVLEHLASYEPMSKVMAAVVTFNRLALLKQCLAAIESQSCPPDEVTVLNNASTDGTRDFLDDWAKERPERRRVIHLDTNTGGAGGFARVIKHAFEKDAEWTWVMDDDSIPAADCLEKLLRNVPHKEIGFLAPMVRFRDGSPCLSNPVQAHATQWSDHFSTERPLIRIVTASFVGLLLNRRAIERAGIPVSKFFIWYDDIEYTSRITSAGFESYCVADATVTHMVAENSIPDFSRVDAKNLWKHQYGIRNETAVVVTTKRFGLARALLLWLQRDGEMRKGKVPLSVRTAVLSWGVKGLFFNYQSAIERP